MYEFYSVLYFEKEGCPGNSSKCYMHTMNVGSGQISLILGVSPLANYMIPRSDNALYAEWLSNRYRNIGFNEHIHFFTSKTLTDLLLLPAFIIPMFGIVLAVLLYYLFGRHSLYDVKQEEKLPSLNMHEYFEKIFAGLIKKKKVEHDLNEKHIHYLKNIFKAEEAEISKWLKTQSQFMSNTHPKDKGASIILLHQKLRKGRSTLSSED